MLGAGQSEMSEVTRIGRYEILSTLEEGDLGIVYQAQDPIIGRDVFLKTIRKDVLYSDDTAFCFSRFKKEALAAARLNHPGIVTLYEYGEDAGVVFIAMEFVEGMSLRDLLSLDEGFGVAGSVDLIVQLLDALAYSHDKGVIHRDLKPANIFLMHDGRIKVTNFGITKFESTDLTQVGNLFETPYYMSPEMVTGRPVDARSDLFSVGAIFYHLLTGEMPFPGNSPLSVMHHVLKSDPPPVSAVNSQVSVGIERVIDKAMAKMVQQRFQSAREFSAALQKSR
jgi:serine/threonine-protein kinase